MQSRSARAPSRSPARPAPLARLFAVLLQLLVAGPALAQVEWNAALSASPPARFAPAMAFDQQR